MTTAQVGSVMCSYNKINGNWSCENPVTLQGDLKQTLGFEGFVMSDWGATHSTSITQGLDIEMPGACAARPMLVHPDTGGRTRACKLLARHLATTSACRSPFTWPPRSAHLGLPRLTSAYLGSPGLTSAYLGSPRPTSAHLGSPRRPTRTRAQVPNS